MIGRCFVFLLVVVVIVVCMNAWNNVPVAANHYCKWRKKSMTAPDVIVVSWVVRISNCADKVSLTNFDGKQVCISQFTVCPIKWQKMRLTLFDTYCSRSNAWKFDSECHSVSPNNTIQYNGIVFWMASLRSKNLHSRYWKVFRLLF